MLDKFLRVLAAMGFALFSFALPASAQDTVRIRGMIERVEGPAFVVKTRDGPQVKLRLRRRRRLGDEGYARKTRSLRHLYPGLY
jgi:hypothetical protein